VNCNFLEGNGSNSYSNKISSRNLEVPGRKNGDLGKKTIILLKEVHISWKELQFSSRKTGVRQTSSYFLKQKLSARINPLSP